MRSGLVETVAKQAPRPRGKVRIGEGARGRRERGGRRQTDRQIERQETV